MHRTLLRLFAPFLAFGVVVIVFLLIPPHASIKEADVEVIAMQTVVPGLAALGMTFVVMSGGIDLSVGSVVALSGVAAALAARSGIDPVLASLIGVAAGALCGCYNGILIVALRLPPFIVTLGTLGAFRGLTKAISSSSPVVADAGVLSNLTRSKPNPAWLQFGPGVWILIALAIVSSFIIHFTVFGRRVRAIGSRAETARLCGVPIARTRILIYSLAGATFGLAGVIQFTRLGQGDPVVSIGLELEVIAAVVIGGASLSGGVGSIAGTLAGAGLMAYMRNRCTRYGWPNYVEEMIIGHIIVVAVAIDQWRQRRNAH